MPRTLSAVKLAQFLVALKSMLPPVTWRTVPMKRALAPSVATNGVIRRRVTARPLSRPPAKPTPSTTASASGSWAESPPGTVTTSTAPSEKRPATERSRPPCWITSV